MKHIIKLILWQFVFGILSISSTIIIGDQFSQAQQVNKYYCRIINGLPTLFYQSKWHEKVPLIRWKTSLDKQSIHEAYCQEVAGRFERFEQENTIDFLTTGTVNNISVVCAVSREGEKCSDRYNSDRVLFALPVAQNPNEALEQLVGFDSVLVLEIGVPSETLSNPNPTKPLEINTDVSTKISTSNPTSTPRQDYTPVNPWAVSRLARNITVEIIVPNVTNPVIEFSTVGSGVIVGKEGSTYYMLTADHIFRYANDYKVTVRSKKAGGYVERLKLKIIRRYPKQDLAVATFASQEEYDVVEVGEASQLSNNSKVYVGGWPGFENREGFQFTPAKVTNPQAGDNLTYQPTEVGEGVYKGMSGGAVLNEEGRLVGIHVRLAEVDGDGMGVLISSAFLQEMPQDVRAVLVISTSARFGNYYCGTSDGVPTLIYQTSEQKDTLFREQEEIPLIRWKTTLSKKLTPQVRCEEAARRFERFARDNTLQFLTAGTVNNLPVVCAVPRKGEECSDQYNSDRVLFTLPFGRDPNEAIKTLSSFASVVEN